LFSRRRVKTEWRKQQMKRRRYQYGSLTKKNNTHGDDVWQFRFYETTPEGHRYRRSTSVGTVAQYPTKTDALRVIEPLRLRLNLHHRFGRPVSVGALVDRYIEHELPERRFFSWLYPRNPVVFRSPTPAGRSCQPPHHLLTFRLTHEPARSAVNQLPRASDTDES